MTISSVDTVDTTLIQDGQAAGSITPSDIRVMNNSLAGIFAPTPKTVSYTLVLADRGVCIEMNSASATIVSVPTNASVAFDIGTVVEVYQMGAGSVTVQAVTPGTTTLRPTASVVVRAQYSSVSMRKRAADEWVVSGDFV